MNPIVVVIRPWPGCDATVAAARALGLDARAAALFVVEARAWKPPPPDAIDALLLGSANAPRHAGAALAGYAGKPAYAVGAETARAARAAGLDVIAVGAGGLEAMLPLLRTGHRRLLRLAGAERLPLAPPPGVTIAERAVYTSEPRAMPGDLVALLATGQALLLLHSAVAAGHVARECDRAGVPRAGVALAALAPRIAAAAGGGWRALEVAPTPADSALLALAARMCQKASSRALGPPRR